MPAPEHPTSHAELAARWRADAQVFRRYGSPGRAVMLERLAAELEQTASDDAAAVVDLSAAASLTGFTRGHLRRLYRDGRLVPVRMEGDDPLFRVADLPRKPYSGGAAPADTPAPVADSPARAALRAVFGERAVRPTRQRRD